VRVGRDGRYGIDASLQGLWVLDPRTDEKRRLLAGEWGHLAWSPDGTQLVVSNPLQILVTPADTVELQQLTFEGSNGYPEWSPDGLWISYNSNAGDSVRTWLIRPDGSDRHAISPPGVPTVMASWFPDGRILHLRAGGVFVMNRDGTGVTQLTTGGGFRECCPVASTDGQRIALARMRDGELPQVWVMDANGSDARQLTRHGGSNPSWSPDGTSVVFSRENWRTNDPGNGVLWVVDVETGTETQLTTRWP
jgi:Tol biopolymer transport system component